MQTKECTEVSHSVSALPKVRQKTAFVSYCILLNIGGLEWTPARRISTHEASKNQYKGGERKQF